MGVEKEADKQTREIIRNENRAMRDVVELLKRVRVGARTAIRKKENNLQQGFNLAPKLAPVLRDLLALQHITGTKRVQAQARNRKSLRLSHVSTADMLDRLKDSWNVGLLQEMYTQEAFGAMIALDNILNEELIRAIDDIIVQQLPVRQSLQLLEDKFETIGITAGKPFRLETVFRTQSQISFQAGKFQEEQDPDVQEIMWGYTYVTVGDDRVRPEHAAIDGTTLPKEDPFWDANYPPNGWNCRCSVIPIFDERAIKNPNPDFKPDPGFEFNPGKLNQDVNSLIKEDVEKPRQTATKKKVSVSHRKEGVVQLQVKNLPDPTKEYAVHYDKFGKQVGGRIQGTENTIATDKALMKKIKGGHVYHNHPNPTNISISDVTFSQTFDVEIVAVTEDGGVYKVRNVTKKLTTEEISVGLASEPSSKDWNKLPFSARRNADLLKDHLRYQDLDKRGILKYEAKLGDVTQAQLDSIKPEHLKVLEKAIVEMHDEGF